MKSDDTKRLKEKILREFIKKFILITSIWVAVIFVFGVLLKDFTSNILFSILGYYRYYSLNSIKGVILMLVYIISIGTLVFKTIMRTIDYVGELSNSINTLFNKKDEFVKLPTELKEIELKLNSIKYEAMRNEQLAKEAEQRKNDLVVYLAHDLKTPLTSIIGYLTLLEEAKDMPIEQRAKYTSITIDKAYRLEELINEFFDITRFNLHSISLENSKINLSFMLHQMVDEFYPMLSDKNLNVITNIEENIVIYADADKLSRVFDNLLRNAVSYSYENADIELSAASKEDKVTICFRNIGNEIPQHKLDSIFEKFFRVDVARGTKTGGSGLGLAIAKQIVDIHKGTIEVTSSRECTKFKVVLPLNQGKE